MSEIVRFSVGREKMATVDSADWPRVQKLSWRWTYNTKKKNVGYVVATTSRKSDFRGTISLHRYLLDPPKDKHVDHINGDRLDNRRVNLRLASRSQNMFNVGKNQKGTSQFKGVMWWEGKWRATISFGGKGKRIGSFKEEWRAALAYDMAAVDADPEFAKTNFPKDFILHLHSTAEKTRSVSQAISIRGEK